MKMTITVGLPASGKTTYADRLVRDSGNTTNVNRDDIRFSQYGVYWGEPIDENVVTDIATGMINHAFKKGRDVIVSDTNLNRKSVKRLVDIASRWGAEVEFQYFDVDIDELVERDLHRQLRGDRGVGEKVIRDMAKRYFVGGKLPVFDELKWEAFNRVPYVPDVTKPKALIVDLDGTIALHDRSPYDYDSLDTDRPNQAVIDLVRREWEAGTTIIFASGRPNSHFQMTRDWIVKHVFEGIMPTRQVYLYMRRTEDKRMDAIVKYEIFDEFIRNEFNVLYCLDDRDQVVDMYRDIGLTVMQVNYGAF